VDPITVFIASVVGALVADALESPGEFTDYYRRPDDLEIFRGWVSMEGRNVVWWVERGEAMWVKARYLRPIEGNIFDSEKLGAVARAVRHSEEPVHFYAPYGQITLITADDIAESIRYADDSEPFTTGDEDLDAWLADPEQYIEDNAWDDESAAEMQAEKVAELATAVKEGWGDLGEWTASVRDGNHRAFGSVLGGEEYVAIRIYDCDITGLQERLRNNEMKPKHVRFLAEIIEDTGGLAWWMSRSHFRPEGSPLWEYEELFDKGAD